MKLTVVGSGDAFGSGGRLQTCYHVAANGGPFLIDCGATSMIGMQRLGLDPDQVSAIFISHLHGDHFSGLVWWLLHAHYVSGRTAPLTVVGPAGIQHRFKTAAEALFPNSTEIALRFAMIFSEFQSQTEIEIGGVRVTPFEVLHPSGAPPYALRFECDEKVLGFSGDTRWVENLIPAAQGADLFIAECFTFEQPVGYHTSWRDIEANINRMAAQRIMLTHMGGEMLASRGEVRDPRILFAEDGLIVDV